MSVFHIKYRDNAKIMVPVTDENEYRIIRGSERQRMLLEKARQGDQDSKRRLEQFNYSCLPNQDGTLKGSTTASTSVGMDIDFHKDDPDYEAKMKTAPQTILSNKDELGLLMLERSATKGYHIVFRRREGLTQEQNLRWASQLLGVAFDEAAKDITRVFFATTNSLNDLIYLDHAIFDNSPSTDASAITTVTTTPPLAEAAQRYSATAESVVVTTVTTTAPLKYQGIPYCEIVDKYWELFNGGKIPTEGDRNVKTYELAMTLRSICEYNPQKLEQVIPRYDGFPEDEWRRTIANACNEPRKTMPYRLRQVLQTLIKDNKIKATGGTMETPPPMPKKLPALLKLLTSKVPDMYKPAVAEGVFPALGAHLHGVKFRYCDNVEHEATFMNVLIAPQSIGKGRIKAPIDCINADIAERDRMNRQREAEYKRQNPTNSGKVKKNRPTDICIQLLIDNLTDAVFNQRIVDANNNGERYIYTIVDEVEGLRKVTSSGKIDDVTEIIRKAFDNALHGQERVGSESVTGIAPLRWNWNASTTPPNAVKFFRKAVNDGTLSRLNISTIIKPEKKPGQKNRPPVIGFYDDKFRQDLQPYINNLNSASGLIQCPQAIKLVTQMIEDNDDRADLYESEAYRILSYRANVIGYLKAMLLYVANNYKWSKDIAEYVRWSVQNDLWCKMRYFGQLLEDALDEEQKIQNAGPQDLLALLPDEFSAEDFRQMRLQQGKSGSADSTLRVWKMRGYIDYDDLTAHWHKTEKYKRIKE